MKKNILFIITSVLIITLSVLYMAINRYQNALKHFNKAGYIIADKNTASGNKSKIYQFTNNTKYKTKYNDNISFSDVNGDKIDISNASFIHYNDDSIGVLKKSVILNLDDLYTQIPKYYNIFDNSMLVYNNGSYDIDNLGKKLKFKRFIVKINDNKYLIVSPNLDVYLDGDKKTKIDTTYIEVSFIDEKVVNIENKKVKYQTIGKDAYIDLGNDMTLNLDNKYIFIKDESKINLDQMIIDSSDNIEIQPLESNEKNDEDELENDSQSNNNEDIENDTSSISTEEENEEEVVESELTIPTADISDIEVGTNKIEGTIKITDNNSLIVGNSVTKIIENSTGKTIDIFENEEGKYTIDVSSNRLQPDTIYTLTTTVNYKKNDIIYTMDIVQNVFSTSSLGINIEKDYFTTDKLVFNIIFDEYSKVQKCDVNLLDTEGNNIEKIPIENDFTHNKTVSFTGLTPDKKYIITVDNILYDDYIMSDDETIEISAKTLKERPNIGDIDFTIDKKKSSFGLQIGNITDKNNGIESYKYQIFDKRKMNAGTDEPVLTINKNNQSEVEVKIDDDVIQRGVGYVYNVVIVFYDNEKYIEYTTPYSEVMQLDGKQPPSVSWNSNEITYERISGTLIIDDPAQVVDTTKPITVVYKNSIGTTLQYTTEGSLTVPFDKNNLRANESYNISLYGTADFQDGNDPIEQYQIGSVIVKTNNTNPFNISFEKNSDYSSIFSVTAQLKNDINNDNRLEASTLTGITFALYEGEGTTGTLVKEVKLKDKDLREYYSDLKTDYYDHSVIIDPSFFDLVNSDLHASKYTIEVRDAYDYTDFKNEIGINNNTFTVSSTFAPDPPQDENDAVDIKYIKNKSSNNPKDYLDPETIVGIQYKAKLNNNLNILKEINYKVYEYDTACEINYSNSNNCKEIEVARRKYVINNQNNVLDYIDLDIADGTAFNVNDTTVTRGHKYRIVYTAVYKDNDNEVIIPSDNKVFKSSVFALPKQDADIKMYPQETTSGSIKISYLYKDPDNTVNNQTLYASINDNIKSQIHLNMSNNNQSFYTQVEIPHLEKGKLLLFTKNNYFKMDEGNLPSGYTNDQIHPYINLDFEGHYSLPELKYHLEGRTNQILIVLDSFDEFKADYNRIAGLNISIKGQKDGKNYTYEKKYIDIEKGIIKLNIMDFLYFIGQEVSVSVEAIYDSGLSGYEMNNDSDFLYALQRTGNDKKYISIKETGELNYSERPTNSILKKELNPSLFVFKDLLNNKIEIDRSPDEGGIVFNYEHVIPKKLETALLTNSGSSNKFTINNVVPGISLLDETGNSRIIPMIQSIELSAAIYGIESLDIKNSEIKIVVNELDESNNILNEENRIEKTVSIEELSTGIEIDGLEPDTNYGIRLYAEIKENQGTYELKQLYDIDKLSDSETYTTRTLSGVNFSDFQVKLSAESYENKSLNISYYMDRTMGYDLIRYKLYEKRTDEITGEIRYVEVPDLEIPDVTKEDLQNNMKLEIDANPSSNINYNKEYRLEVKPIYKAGDNREVELTNTGGEYEFKLLRPNNPYIAIKSDYEENSDNPENLDLIFITTIYDREHTIQNDNYKVTILYKDGNNEIDVTPEEYKNQQQYTSIYNKKFRLNNREPGGRYTIQIDYVLDELNNGEGSQTSYSYSVKLLNPDSINVGDITAVPSRYYSNRVDLLFRGSRYLTSIDTLNYSIYNISDGTTKDGKISFSPKEKTIGSETLYVQSLPDSFTTDGQYYIQTQFIKDNEVVYNGGTDYTYLSN